MQIAVKIEPQQIGRSVRRAAGVLDGGFGKTQRAQVQAGDEGIQKADGIIGGDVILQAFGQQQGLVAVPSATMIPACNRPSPGVMDSKHE